MKRRLVPWPEPDFTGPFGKAWDVTGAKLSNQSVVAIDAFMGGWLLYAPAAHPLWNWHVLMGIHLRDVEGQSSPPHLRFPGATHEIICLAINPEKEGGLHPGDANTFHYLRPPDFAEQIILPRDAHCAELLSLGAHAVVDGMLVPDSDFRGAWQASLNATAEHFRLGGHPDEDEAA